MEKIKQILKSSNYILRIDIQSKEITKEDINSFCKKYNLDSKYSPRIDGLIFFKGGTDELMTDFKSIFNND